MSESINNKHETYANTTPEQLCETEISPKQVRELVDFLDKNDCKNAHQAYEKFMSDVPEEDKAKDIEVSFLDDIKDSKLKHFDDRVFEHIRLFNGGEKTDDEISPLISGRLYICPSAENMQSMVERLVESHSSRGVDLICKFAKNMSRNDRIVIYLTENFDEELNLIRDIQNESPELFAKCRKNKLWCDIDGIENVYYGEENKTKVFTYGESRARIIGEIFTLQKEGLIDLKNDNQAKRTYQLECLKYRVNPFNWGFYIDDDKTTWAASTVLLGFTNPKFLQTQRYIDCNKTVDDWVNSNSNKSNSWLGDNIPEYSGT